MDSGQNMVYPTLWPYVCVAIHCLSRVWPQPLYCHWWYLILCGARPLKTWSMNIKIKVRKLPINIWLKAFAVLDISSNFTNML